MGLQTAWITLTAPIVTISAISAISRRCTSLLLQFFDRQEEVDDVWLGTSLFDSSHPGTLFEKPVTRPFRVEHFQPILDSGESSYDNSGLARYH